MTVIIIVRWKGFKTSQTCPELLKVLLVKGTLADKRQWYCKQSGLYNKVCKIDCLLDIDAFWVRFVRSPISWIYGSCYFSTAIEGFDGAANASTQQPPNKPSPHGGLPLPRSASATSSTSHELPISSETKPLHWRHLRDTTRRDSWRETDPNGWHESTPPAWLHIPYRLALRIAPGESPREYRSRKWLLRRRLQAAHRGLVYIYLRLAYKHRKHNFLFQIGDSRYFLLPRLVCFLSCLVFYAEISNNKSVELLFWTIPSSSNLHGGIVRKKKIITNECNLEVDFYGFLLNVMLILHSSANRYSLWTKLPNVFIKRIIKKQEKNKTKLKQTDKRTNGQRDRQTHSSVLVLGLFIIQSKVEYCIVKLVKKRKLAEKNET